MRVIIAVGFTAVVAAVLASYVRSSIARGCRTGEARAFVAIRQDPAYLVGTIPATFTEEAAFFQRRYNCTGQSAAVRRVDEGIYDVRLRGLIPRLALASAISDEGVSASVLPLGNDTVRVALRGPLRGNAIASRRDVAFSLVVY